MKTFQTCLIREHTIFCNTDTQISYFGLILYEYTIVNVKNYFHTVRLIFFSPRINNVKPKVRHISVYGCSELFYVN